MRGTSPRMTKWKTLAPTLTRRLRFRATLAAVRSGRRLRCMGDPPLHAAGLSGLAGNHDLDGAARALLPAQVDALLELHRTLLRRKCPYVPVGQREHHAVAVGKPHRLDARMQMEAQRERVERGVGERGAADGKKDILALDVAAVGGDADHALVCDAEAPRVAVVG